MFSEENKVKSAELYRDALLAATEAEAENDEDSPRLEDEAASAADAFLQV